MEPLRRMILAEVDRMAHAGRVPGAPLFPPPLSSEETWEQVVRRTVRGVLDRIADFEAEGAEKIREWFGDRLLPRPHADGEDWQLAHNLGAVLLRRGWIPPRGPLGDRPELVEYFLWWVIKEICDPLVGLSPTTPWHVQILAALVGSETLLSSLAEAMGAPGWGALRIRVLREARRALRPIRGRGQEFPLLLDVLEMARLGGWQVVILNWPSGTPDLVLLRGPEILAVELKSRRGRPKEQQREILARLAAAGLEVHLWRPQDRSSASARLRGRANEQNKEASCAT